MLIFGNKAFVPEWHRKKGRKILKSSIELQ